MLLYCYTPFNWSALEDLLATPDSLLLSMLLEKHAQGRGFQLSTLPKDTDGYAKALPRFLASEDWHAQATNVDAQRIGELLERIFLTFPDELRKPNPFKLRLRITFPTQLKSAYFNNNVEMSLWDGWAQNLAVGLRACFKSSSLTCKTSGHQVYHGDMNHCFAVFCELFIIL